MTTGPDDRKQVGTQINTDLYRRLRALAILQNRRVGALIDDAIKDYLAKNNIRVKAETPKRTK